MAGGKQCKARFGGVLVACLAALIQTSMAATSHTVGDGTGWTIPSPSSLYTTWASKQTFKVGDSLVFNFQTSAHTVAEVSKSAYDACTTSNPISTYTTGPATVTIKTPGSHYFICTIPGHCSAGQKLAITATGSSSAAPSSSPASSPAPSTAVPSSSPTSSPAPSAAVPSSSPTSSPAPSTAAPSSSPPSSPAPSTAPTPSSSGSAAPSPSGVVPSSPTTPTVPSPQSPAGGTAPPPPSSATVAGAGLVLPVMMITAAFLV